jgi:hypothetical protein
MNELCAPLKYKSYESGVLRKKMCKLKAVETYSTKKEIPIQVQEVFKTQDQNRTSL